MAAETSRLAAPTLTIGPRTFIWGQRTYIMGVVNCSPESFSGDGLSDVHAAVTLAREMADNGADLLDVGGQSTRPGADKSASGFTEVTPGEEIRRTAPVIERLRADLPSMPISIDTYKPEVARAAIAAGAHLLNDITGFRGDPEIARIAADAGLPAVAMHNQRGRAGDDVIAAIRQGLGESLRIAAEAGLPRERLILDPGFGFGWRAEQNVEMLRRLSELRDLGLPLLIGTSRKSTLATVLDEEAMEDRIWGTAATVALAIAGGIDIVRVHDVRAMKRVATMADAVVRGWPRAAG